MNDETWYVVRTTRGVTSFVGPGSKPVPLTDAEVRAMGIGGEVESLDVEIGDTVRVAAGHAVRSFNVSRVQVRHLHLGNLHYFSLGQLRNLCFEE